MSPAADLDEKLIALQAKVAEARATHEDLCGRQRTLQAQKLYASANALQHKVDVAFNQFSDASTTLASYISKKQRRRK